VFFLDPLPDPLPCGERGDQTGAYRQSGLRQYRSPVAIDTSATTDGFLGDVKASLAAWRRAPLLPIVAAALIAAYELTLTPHPSSLLFALGFGVGIFSVGWIGTQLVWYRRIFEGQAGMKLGELVQVTSRFIVPYFLLIFIAAVPGLAVLLVVGIRTHTLAFSTPTGRAGVLAYIAFFQVIGTFVVPAVAFSTRKVTKAIPTGLAMLARGWRRNWAYAAVPGLADALVAGIYWWVPAWTRPVVEVVSTLVLLAFAGAIARYYLRHALTPLNPPE
jgi:hypothetical protein